VQGVFYIDGSSKPNPGPSYGGYGVHGYLCDDTTKKINPRHPVYNNLFFTTKGYSDVKPDTFVEVATVVETAVAIDKESESNNFSELLAFKWVLDNYLVNEEVKSVYVITDSSYVVSCYTDMLPVWAGNGWLKADGTSVVHKETWVAIYETCKRQIEAGKSVNITWVKGHSGDYGNETADLYAAVGSTASKYQQTVGATSDFCSLLFHKTFTPKEYKESFSNKDIIYNFKHLYFSNSPGEHDTHCFLFNPPDKESHSGKRTLESMFSINIGYVPEVVTKLKEYHRSLPRQFYGPACMKINSIGASRKLRLFSWVPACFLLTTSGLDNSVYIVKEDLPVMYDVGNKLPLFSNMTKMFNTMTEIDSKSLLSGYDVESIDVTEMFVKEKKIAFSNRVKSLDISDMVGSLGYRTPLVSRVSLTIGSDTLSYLSLKQAESVITKVTVRLGFNESTNSVTCLVCFELENRRLIVSNISNKFLARF
jgi:ribonuclease HI